MRCHSALSLLCCAGLAGCAAPNATSNCVTGYAMSPGTATADHRASAPGNTVQYGVRVVVISGTGCAIPQVEYPMLATSDPVNVSVATTGQAVCTGATNGPATLTDIQSIATAQLTCQ